jgi:hypothetical protein
MNIDDAKKPPYDNKSQYLLYSALIAMEKIAPNMELNLRKPCMEMTNTDIAQLRTVMQQNKKGRDIWKQFNRNNDFSRESVCKIIEAYVKSTQTMNEDNLAKFSERLSNDLVLAMALLPEGSKQRLMKEEALRMLGADESLATYTAEDIERESRNILEKQELQRQRRMERKMQRDAASPPAPRSGRAQSRGDSSGQPMRTAKMMVGRVKSAMRKNEERLDGTPMYQSYLKALRTLAATHPEVTALPDVRMLLSEHDEYDE